MEEFSLVATFDNGGNIIPNVYGMVGQGPSYTYDPIGTTCLISNQKRMGFSVFEIPYGTNPTNAPVLVPLRGTVGNLVNSTKSIGTKSQGDATGDPNVIEFDAFLSPFPLP